MADAVLTVQGWKCPDSLKSGKAEGVESVFKV